MFYTYNPILYTGGFMQEAALRINCLFLSKKHLTLVVNRGITTPMTLEQASKHWDRMAQFFDDNSIFEKDDFIKMDKDESLFDNHKYETKYN